MFEFLAFVLLAVNLQCKGLLFTRVLLFELRERPSSSHSDDVIRDVPLYDIRNITYGYMLQW
jgi:hypothetical protein